MKPPVLSANGTLASRPLVLVVDDDPSNLRLVEEVLAPLDLNLRTAASARRAFDAIQEGPPDLILLDRIMPGETGIDLLRRLRADARFAKIPVIIQTGCASTRELREGFDAGAAYYVTKPLDHDLLRGVVSGALRTATQPRVVASEQSNPALQSMRRGCFEFRTLDEALDLAFQLGQLCPDPESAVLGLAELMVNAVEHGNLEISYAEKSTLCRSQSWRAEVLRRLEHPDYRRRMAHVNVERRQAVVRFEVCDEGPGFDWRKFMSFDPERAFDPNGRGIALAQQVAFSNLNYQEPGNVVVAEVPLKSPA